MKLKFTILSISSLLLINLSCKKVNEIGHNKENYNIPTEGTEGILNLGSDTIYMFSKMEIIL
ncbi:hypothetical protein [Sphingobacterium lactis]|uniref:hypothetical protein n=1 Tax=Sphingobacterium lactis TaxID=797291 RepID=UPI003DA51694